MHKILMLAVTLLLSAAWLQAQTMEKGSKASSQTSVEGCLQGSNGTFTVTDNSGTTYTLEGDTSKLTEHVGHEVQITGTASAASEPSSSSAPASGGSHTLTVQKVKHISKTCKSMSK
jgi:Protein of unknown function (DUF5818)